MTDNENHKAKIIKANYRLQQKVGAGPLDEKTIKASQNVIDTNRVEFEPLGLAILRRLDEAISKASEPNASMQHVRELIIAPVMELKANAAIFRYALAGNLANIMLSFLESIRTIDKDVIDIVRAHHNTLRMIVVQKISGNGGETGKQLVAELQSACNRYHNKKFTK